MLHHLPRFSHTQRSEPTRSDYAFTGPRLLPEISSRWVLSKHLGPGHSSIDLKLWLPPPQSSWQIPLQNIPWAPITRAPDATALQTWLIQIIRCGDHASDGDGDTSIDLSNDIVVDSVHELG